MLVIPFRWIRTYALVVLVSLISNITAFFRDALITAKFGATMVTDAYTIALLIPEVLFNIFGSSLAANYIPVYYEAERCKRHRQFSSMLFSLYLLLAGLIFFFGFTYTNFLIQLFSSGFSAPAFSTTNNLLRIFLVNIFFLTITGFFLVFLQTHRRFLIPSAVGIFYNLAIISCIFNLGAGIGLSTLIIGTLTGFIVQLAALIPQAVYLGVPLPSWRITFSPEIRKYVLLSLPVALITVLGQLTILMENYFASRLGEGSITTLNLGNRALMGIYSTLIISTMTVVYPVLSRSIVNKDFQFSAELIQKVVNLLIMLLLPLQIYFLVNAAPLIDLLFKRGAFTTEQSAVTAMVFQGYIIGLLFYAFRDLLLKYFFAAYDIPVLLLNGLANTLLNFLYLAILVPLIGLPGVSLAAALSVGSSCLILYLFAAKKTPVFRQLQFFQLICKVTVASGLSILLQVLTKPSINLLLAGEHPVDHLIQQGSQFIIFGLAYCLFCLLMFKRGLLDRVIPTIK